MTRTVLPRRKWPGAATARYMLNRIHSGIDGHLPRCPHAPWRFTGGRERLR